MNKSARLQDMMLFLNDKNSFNLKDLMDKYTISRSTALRDVQSLEEIGMPIYSQPGRNGYYGILPNRLLSPIVFNMDEVFALYFSMLTLRAYESTPFHLEVEKLKQKFENCLSTEKIELLHKVEKVFRLGAIKQHSHCQFLRDIMQSAVEENVCDIKYQREHIEGWYSIQFYDITSVYGQWYATGFNFETERPQVFRCDRILDLKGNDKYQPKALSEFLKPAENLYKNSTATDFEVEVSTCGVDSFYKEHYPSMKLFRSSNEEHGDRYFIRGFYNQGEEAFIASYFINYGEKLIAVQPASLQELMIKRLNQLNAYISKL